MVAHSACPSKHTAVSEGIPSSFAGPQNQKSVGMGRSVIVDDFNGVAHFDRECRGERVCDCLSCIHRCSCAVSNCEAIGSGVWSCQKNEEDYEGDDGDKQYRHHHPCVAAPFGRGSFLVHCSLGCFLKDRNSDNKVTSFCEL